jgi:hypothetical protein
MWINEAAGSASLRLRRPQGRDPMRRLFVAVPIVLVAVAIATPATALTTVREPIPLANDVRLEGFCSFPVIANDIAGGQTQTTYLDDQGNVVRIQNHGHLVSTFTNPENGKSVTFNNSGPVTITFNDDGTLTVVQRGQSISGDQGVISGHPFLIHNSGRLVSVGSPDATTGFLDFVSQTREGDTTDVCAALS